METCGRLSIGLPLDHAIGLVATMKVVTKSRWVSGKRILLRVSGAITNRPQVNNLPHHYVKSIRAITSCGMI